MPASLLNAAGDIGTGAATNGTSLTVNKPVNAVAGDFLLAVLYNRTNTATTDFTIPAAGWTAVSAQGGASGTYVLYSRTVVAGDPASWVWAGASSGRLVGMIFRTSGLSSAAPLDVSGGYATAVGGTPPTLTVAAISPAGAGDLLLAVVGTNNNPVSSFTSAATSLVGSAQTATGATESGLQVFQEQLAAAGPTGTRLFSATTATITAGSGALFALRAVSTLTCSPSVTPASGSVPFTVSSTGSFAGGTGTPVTYAWNWGDSGVTPAQASPTATHLYTVAGTYTVTLTVVNT